MINILFIGEILVEIARVEKDLYKKSFAGDTFNAAHYLSKVSLGCVQVDYLTALGNDRESDQCLDFIRQHGVSTRRCLRSSTHTLGLFVLTNDDKGEKQYAYWRDSSATRYLFDRPQDLTGYEWICLSGITLAITKNKDNLIQSLQHARDQGARIVFDFNYRQLLWSVDEARVAAQMLLPLCDLVKISDEELTQLFPHTNLQQLSMAHPKAEWVLTSGGASAATYCAGVLEMQLNFSEVDTVVDSSAAGDSFLAAYLEARLRNQSYRTALGRGHCVAAQVITANGSIVPIQLAELETIYDQ